MPGPEQQHSQVASVDRMPGANGALILFIQEDFCENFAIANGHFVQQSAHHALALGRDDVRLEIDRWILDAAALCQSRDPQLDLRGALPAVPAIRKAELAAA